MHFIGIGTAVPPQRYTQRDCWRSLKASAPFPALAPRSRALLRKVLCGDNGIATRHLALENLTDAFSLTPDALHERFVRHAPLLATQAAERALADADTAPSEIDALIVSTCTGYLCPGLSGYVVERAGLRSEVIALDLVGQGCAAAIPNLRLAESLLAAGRCQRVLSICVEVCSAAFYLDDDPGVLISACLFADSAGAAVLAMAPNPKRRRIAWQTASSWISPGERDLLRFEQRNGMLRNLLSRGVPDRAGQAAAKILNETLARAGVPRDQIAGWILHPGGRDVLVALRKRLGLAEADLRWSAEVLREFGNLSSPSLFFVLQRALAGGAPGGFWWMSSFGAGFSCHGALLRVD